MSLIDRTHTDSPPGFIHDQQVLNSHSSTDTHSPPGYPSSVEIPLEIAEQATRELNSHKALYFNPPADVASFWSSISSTNQPEVDVDEPADQAITTSFGWGHVDLDVNKQPMRIQDGSRTEAAGILSSPEASYTSSSSISYASPGDQTNPSGPPAQRSYFSDNPSSTSPTFFPYAYPYIDSHQNMFPNPVGYSSFASFYPNQDRYITSYGHPSQSVSSIQPTTSTTSTNSAYSQQHSLYPSQQSHPIDGSALDILAVAAQSSTYPPPSTATHHSTGPFPGPIPMVCLQQNSLSHPFFTPPDPLPPFPSVAPAHPFHPFPLPTSFVLETTRHAQTVQQMRDASPPESDDSGSASGSGPKRNGKKHLDEVLADSDKTVKGRKRPRDAPRLKGRISKPGPNGTSPQKKKSGGCSADHVKTRSLIFPPELPPRMFVPAPEEGYVFRSFPESNLYGARYIKGSDSRDRAGFCEYCGEKGLLTRMSGYGYHLLHCHNMSSHKPYILPGPTSVRLLGNSKTRISLDDACSRSASTLEGQCPFSGQADGRGKCTSGSVGAIPGSNGEIASWHKMNFWRDAMNAHTGGRGLFCPPSSDY
ncbi:Protein of unknown function DUF4451 [Phaffia rhodozyma]|uniref:Uncharacterized protein n=1 Tax=Phaffia rhodozyma TaxID=264483 RepID=A0A0F7SR35_PHARH|nr:Protein of unknown function DUF4451 [Phaffia rhodozyma]